MEAINYEEISKTCDEFTQFLATLDPKTLTREEIDILLDIRDQQLELMFLLREIMDFRKNN